MGVLQHVAGERHREVEVQAKLAGAVGSACSRWTAYTSLSISPCLASRSSGSTARVSIEANPCSSKVSRSRSSTYCSTIRASGVYSGKPGQRPGAAHATPLVAASTRAVRRCGRRFAVLQIRVARPFPGDGGLRAVAGQHPAESGSGSTLVRRLFSMSAWFPPGKSVLPIEPANRTSPGEDHRVNSVGWHRRESGTWPSQACAGRVDYPEAQARRGQRCPVAEFVYVVRLGEVRRPPVSRSSSGRVSCPMARSGSVSSSRSQGASSRSRRTSGTTGVTENMWSRWPWVSITATGLSRCSMITRRRRRRVHARIDDHALLAEPVATT